MDIWVEKWLSLRSSLLKIEAVCFKDVRGSVKEINNLKALVIIIRVFFSLNGQRVIQTKYFLYTYYVRSRKTTFLCRFARQVICMEILYSTFLVFGWDYERINGWS